jgi:hypothetical protein
MVRSRMRVRWASAACGVAVAAWAPLLTAQTAERPRWRVGDKWVFRQRVQPPPVDSTWDVSVTEALPDGHFKVRYSSGLVAEFDGEGNRIDVRGPEYSWRTLAFPLSVGHTWTHDYKIAGETWSGYVNSRWNVLAYEKVTVPAGTFDCFKVEGMVHSYWSGGARVFTSMNRGLQHTYYWYCPEVSWAAKWIIDNTANMSGARTTTVWELEAFTRKPAS